MAVIKLTAQNFEQEVVNSEKPVLVDFYADWCGPCKMMAPVVEEIAEEKEDAKVCKLNIDEEMEIAQKYGVMSIPTLMVFKDGKVDRKKRFGGKTQKRSPLHVRVEGCVGGDGWYGDAVRNRDRGLWDAALWHNSL